MAICKELVWIDSACFDISFAQPAFGLVDVFGSYDEFTEEWCLWNRRLLTPLSHVRPFVLLLLLPLTALTITIAALVSSYCCLCADTPTNHHPPTLG